MKNLSQDLRYAVRQLRKSPAFTAVAVLTLALGIGANTAMFSVLNAVLLKALPVTDPERLYQVQIGQGQPDGASQTGNSSNTFSMPVFAALRTRTDVLDDLVAFVPLSFNRTPVRVGNTPEEVWADEVSGNFFSGLSAPLALGRGFTREDEDRHAAIAVIGYGLWTSRFNRDPGVLGKTVFVKGVPFTVVGVAGAGFAGLEAGTVTDLWIPLQNSPTLNAWGVPGTTESLYSTPNWWALQMVARLRPGVTPAQASEALRGSFGAAAMTGLKSGSPGNWKPVLDFREAKGIAGYSDSLREPMRVLMGLMLLVLLIACTNVATMLLARNAARQREFSLRLAMGAGQRRLLAQLLAESALLVSGGTLLGWGLAIYATGWLARMAAIETGLRPDGHVLLFTLGLSLGVSLLFGLAPLWSATRAPVADVLRAGATNLSLERGRVWSGRTVMAGQVTVGLLLLMAAGLLLRTLNNYGREQLGMQAEKLLVFGVTPQGVEGKEATAAFYRTLVERLGALPGVRGVTLAENRPGSGWSDNNDIVLDGVHQDGIIVRSNSVGGAFFRTLGVPVLEGREIEDRDATGPLVAVVNQSFAQRFFPHTSPIGHRSGTKNPITIVGVVADSKYTGVDEEPRPMMYYPALAAPEIGTLQVELRAEGDPLLLLNEARRTVSAINPNIPLQQPMTQNAQFEASYAQPRMVGDLGAFFGVLAAVLVATGLYGTLSYRTNRRSLEIGVRMAVGARRGQVLWLVLRESLLVLVAGAVAAAPLALFGLRLLQSMLYRVSAFDPGVLASAVGCVAAVVVLASLVPARRAASVEPVRALRAE